MQLVRARRIELLPDRRQRPTQTTTPRPQIWWETARVERPATKGRRLQRRDRTRDPYLHLPKMVAGVGIEPTAPFGISL